MKYAKWKMAISRSLNWVDDKNIKDDDGQGKFSKLKICILNFIVGVG